MSETSANLVYACDQWEIDLGRRELRSRGTPVPLGGRAFEIVKVLVQTTGLVTRNHMMEQVWPGIIVSEAWRDSFLTFIAGPVRRQLIPG